MSIEIKSNIRFMLKVFLPFAILGFVLNIAMITTFIAQKEIADSDLMFFIIFLVMEIFLVALVLFLRFYKGKCYKFFEDKVLVYNKGIFINEISLEEIESMQYFKFKFRYIITIFAGALNEGSCWRLYLKFKNGAKANLAFFSIKDIKKLKELYSNLITVN